VENYEGKELKKSNRTRVAQESRKEV